IFYLGHDCVHCIEQLKAFNPAVSQFAEAGIRLLGISVDAPEKLPRTTATATSGEENPFSIPLVSDVTRAGFKAFGAYDDFEGLALHGTFLVDAAGRVRWQDISYEPFKDVSFLVRE